MPDTDERPTPEDQDRATAITALRCVRAITDDVTARWRTDEAGGDLGVAVEILQAVALHLDDQRGDVAVGVSVLKDSVDIVGRMLAVQTVAAAAAG